MQYVECMHFLIGRENRANANGQPWKNALVDWSDTASLLMSDYLVPMLAMDSAHWSELGLRKGACPHVPMASHLQGGFLFCI